jgi:hypothetical protein
MMWWVREVPYIYDLSATWAPVNKYIPCDFIHRKRIFITHWVSRVFTTANLNTGEEQCKNVFHLVRIELYSSIFQLAV